MPAEDEALARTLDQLGRDAGVVGFAVAVIDHDRIRLLRGFGQRDRSTGEAMTPDTPMLIASLTKSFTAFLAVQAADRGKLALDASPRTVLPGFHLRDLDADAHATLRDLLAHRTGLVASAGDLALAFEAVDFDQLLGLIAAAQPTAKLGAKWQYTNVLYAVAGEAAARAQGRTFAQLFDAEIVAPLGMTATALPTRAAPSAPAIPGYLLDGDQPPIAIAAWHEPSVSAPAGAIRSTARDMAVWVRLLLGRGALGPRRLISEAAFAELVAPQIELAPGISYGLGLLTRSWRGHRAIEHGGAAPGVEASLAFLPDDGVGFVVLSNTMKAPARNAIKDAIFAHLLGDPPMPARPAAQPAAPPAWEPLPARAPNAREVMRRAVAAIGGARALERHHTWSRRERVQYANQGVEGELRTWAAAPARWAEHRTIIAGGRRLGTRRLVFDGARISLDEGGPGDRAIRLPAAEADAMRETHDFYREAGEVWKSVALLGIAKLDGEPAFVVEKTAASGTTIRDLISTRTFLLLERDQGAQVERFRHYRVVDGVRVAFDRAVHDDAGDWTAHVEAFRFDDPDAANALE